MIKPPNYLSNLWEKNKNWILPIIPNIALRKTKFIVSCSDCQNERIISYCQAWNIIKDNHYRDCKKCLQKQGKLTRPTKHLNNYRNIKGKGLGRKNPKVSVRSYYNTLFNPISKEELENRRKKYNKKSYQCTSKRLKEDKIFYAIKIVRNRVWNFMKNQNMNSMSRKLGCNYQTFKHHIEAKFKPGMTWDNYGKWHIDHIYPLSVAAKQSDDVFLKACHYTNLQPLWASENFSKGNKVI